MKATAGAFAAVLKTGEVVTWGHPALGGDTGEVQNQLQNLVGVGVIGAADDSGP